MEVYSFLGLSEYYRKFIKNYSTIAKPLTELTKISNTFGWTSECQGEFIKLKIALCSAPVLRYPDFEKEFALTTDASNIGCGAILSQDGHPCCYTRSVQKESGIHLYLRAGVTFHHRVGGILQSNPHLIE